MRFFGVLPRETTQRYRSTLCGETDLGDSFFNRGLGTATIDFVVKNGWNRVYNEDKTDSARKKGLIRYYPPLRKLIVTQSIVSPNGNREPFKIYDPLHNATVIYRSPFNSAATETWVYR